MAYDKEIRRLRRVADEVWSLVHKEGERITIFRVGGIEVLIGSNGGATGHGHGGDPGDGSHDDALSADNCRGCITRNVALNLGSGDWTQTEGEPVEPMAPDQVAEGMKAVLSKMVDEGMADGLAPDRQAIIKAVAAGTMSPRQGVEALVASHQAAGDYDALEGLGVVPDNAPTSGGPIGMYL